MNAAAAAAAAAAGEGAHAADGAARPRSAGVDTLRVLAVVAIVAIHTTPLERAGRPIGTGLDAATLLNEATRFAVPFFFVVAGFFWARKVAEAGAVRAPTLALVRRALLVWGAWWLVYLLPWNLGDALSHGAAGPLKVLWWKLALVARRPAIALLEGTSPHLWFLVALAACAAVSAAFWHRRALPGLALLAAALYALGLAGQAYPGAPFGFRLGADWRNGHLFALAFFATGVWLQRRGAAARWLPAGALLAAAGLALHLLESWAAHRWWGQPLQHDYAAGTYLFGVGVALMGLAGLARPPRPRWRRIGALGPSVLGIYASHMIFVALLAPLDRRLTGPLWWEVAYVAAVFGLALALTRTLARFRATRPLVA